MEQVHQFFAEARRVLRIGGVLSISSMRPTTPEAAAQLLATVRSQIRTLEEKSLVPTGSSEIFFNSNVNLMNRSPTTFTDQAILEIGQQYGFRRVQTGSGNYGHAFFASFERVD